MGLTSVYSIIKKHGGAVTVSSTCGVGSCFTVYLPALPCPYSEMNESKEPERHTGSGRVLIMDDEAAILDIATEILQFIGYEVESCSDGLKAVERFNEAMRQNAPFSAVILDLTVPGGMGGKQAGKLILETSPDVALIVSSGYSDDPIMADYRKHGFSAAIPKPFSANILAEVLERLIPKKFE